MSAEWIATFTVAGIYGLVAIGIQLGMMSGAFSLAPVGWMSIGAYSTALAVTEWDSSASLGLLVAIGLGCAFGPLVVLPVGRISGLYFALVTLGFVLVVQSVAAHVDHFGGAQGIFGVPLTTELGHVIALLAVAAAVATWLSTGQRGRTIRAAGQDPTVARALGVPVLRLRLALGAVSAVLGVVAGYLYAGYVGYVDPTQFGFALVVQILLMVIVGGRGSWLGSIAGAALVMSLPVLLRPLAEWRDVMNGGLLIAVAILLPGGIVSLVTDVPRRVVSAVRRRRTSAPLDEHLAGSTEGSAS